MRESLEDLKPYGQTLLFMGSAIVGVVGVSRYISKLEERIGKLEVATDLRFGEVVNTTDAKIKAVKAEVETISTQDYLKYSQSAEYASLHSKESKNSSPSDGSSTNP
jgi:hypothetical protein